MPKKRKRISISDPSSGSFGSLGDLFKQAGYTASDKETAREQEQADDNKDGEKPVCRSETKKIVIRTERKGRGGKTVTIVEGLHGTEPELQEMAKKMRKRLGCGSAVEGRCIVFQGSLVDRVTEWLAENGIKKVIS